MQLEIMWLTARQLLTWRRLSLLGGAALLPPFVALLYALSNSTLAPDRFLSGLCDDFVLTTVLPLIALILGVAALGNELEDGTILYLLMKPVPRWRIALAKLLPPVVIVAVLTASSVLLSTLITGRDSSTWQDGLAFTVGTAAGAAGYTATFVALSVLTRQALVIGLLYSLIWEGALTGLFVGLRAVSIREYARGIAAGLADLPVQVDISAAGALIGIALVAALAFAVLVRRLHTLDLISGGSS